MCSSIVFYNDVGDLSRRKKKSREYKDGEIQKSEGKKNELLPTHNLIIRRPSVVNVTPFSPPMTLVYVGCTYTCV
jgi:hypothetical protein